MYSRSRCFAVWMVFHCLKFLTWTTSPQKSYSKFIIHLNFFKNVARKRFKPTLPLWSWILKSGSWVQKLNPIAFVAWAGSQFAVRSTSIKTVILNSFRQKHKKIHPKRCAISNGPLPSPRSRYAAVALLLTVSTKFLLFSFFYQNWDLYIENDELKIVLK